jgi:tetratricopeptide (TPR) repeat protein
VTILVAIAGVAAGGSGCIKHGNTPLAAPSQSGAAWRELRSDHFTLVTDLDSAEAHGVMGMLERTYGLLGRVLFGAGRPPQFQTRVVCFRSESEFREFVPFPIRGIYKRDLPLDIEPVPAMVIFGGLSPENKLTLAHELGHRFNHAAFGSLPVWLEEGLASFHSTIRGEIDQPVVGEMNPEEGFASGSAWSRPDDVVYKGWQIPIARLPKASTLIGLDRRTFYSQGDPGKPPSEREKEATAGHYAAAWGLVHMLALGAPRYAEPFNKALADPAERRRLGLTFGYGVSGVDRATLDRDFEDYLRKPTRWRQHHESSVPRADRVDEQILAEGRVLTWWARIDSFGERSRRRLEQALAASADDPEVQFWYARHRMLDADAQIAERHFKLAIDRAPDDVRAQMALALLYLGFDRAVWPPPEREARLRGAMARLAELARGSSELNLLAAYHLIHKQPKQALEHAAGACERDPGCWQCFHNHALAWFLLGHPSRAALLARTALDLLPEDAPSDTEQMLIRAVQSYAGERGQDGQAPKSSPGNRAALPPVIVPR